jgi:hypothetical protein
MHILDVQILQPLITGTFRLNKYNFPLNYILPDTLKNAKKLNKIKYLNA